MAIILKHQTVAVAAEPKRIADEIERLRAVLREAMQQATEYDGLDVSKIGPQHWYSQASAVLGPNTRCWTS